MVFSVQVIDIPMIVHLDDEGTFPQSLLLHFCQEMATLRMALGASLLPNDLDQHPLPPPAVELAVEDPLPRAKVEAAVGYRDDDLAAHDLSLQVGVGVVFAGAVVPVLVNRCVRSQPFEPHLVIMM